MYGVGASSSRRSQHQDYDFALGNTSAGVPSSSASSTPSSAAQHLDQSRRIHNPAAGGARQERFGFDDRFDGGKFGNGDSSDEDDEDAESGGCALGRDDDDDDDDGFGPFSDNFAAAPSKGQASAGGFAFDDDFTGTSSSAAGQSNKGSSTSSVGEKAKLTRESDPARDPGLRWRLTSLSLRSCRLELVIPSSRSSLLWRLWRLCLGW